MEIKELRKRATRIKQLIKDGRFQAAQNSQYALFENVLLAISKEQVANPPSFCKLLLKFTMDGDWVEVESPD